MNECDALTAGSRKYEVQVAKNPAPSLPEVPRLLTAIQKNVGWESALLGWLYFYLFGNLLCILDTHPTSLGLNLFFLKLGVGSK